MKTKPELKKGKTGKRGALVKERAMSYEATTMSAKDVLPYASFEITNFRCFDTLRIDSLNRINLVTGLNNTGKTSLLEALFLSIGSRNPILALIVNSWRGLDIVSESAENQWGSLFWQFRDSQPIKLIGTTSKGSRRSLEIRTEPSGSTVMGEKPYQEGEELILGQGQNILFTFIDEAGGGSQVKGTPFFVRKDNKIRYELKVVPSLPRATMTGIFVGNRGNLNEEIQRFSNLRKAEKDGIVLDALKIVEPRLERLEILTYQGVSMIHGYLKAYDQPLPSPLLGDGVRRSLSVLLAIGAAGNGVVLVDEIENGIHHSAMKALWSVIAEAARAFNCQVFATTHSEECIYAAHDAMKESDQYDLMLYRLDRKNGSINAVGYDEERLDAALSIPLEVRGWPQE